MSYDLYFTSPKISREQFLAYFGESPRYTVNESQASYSNEDTGVYFFFDFNDAPAEDEQGFEYSVAFNMNYYRPHFFVEEAEPEVSEFVERFGCSIHDPQDEGMKNGPYSRAGLTKAWNHGNEFGYQAILNHQNAPEVVHSRPTAELEAVFRWNRERNARHQRLQKDIFVPRIVFLLLDGRVCSACVWPDAISTLIPRVDRLLIPRSELAPKRFFRGNKDDLCVIPFEEALSVLSPYAVEGYEMEAFELPSPFTPHSLKNFVRSLGMFEGQPVPVPMDQVLNRELVEKYRKKS